MIPRNYKWIALAVTTVGVLMVAIDTTVVILALPVIMGFNSTTFGVGSIVGPVLGGIILATTTWRWIFLINVPIGVFGTAISYRYLRELSAARHDEKLDFVGTIVFSVSLISLLFALTESIDLSLTSAPILTLFGISLVTVLFFVFWESRTSHPALDLQLFHSRLYDFSVLAAMFQSLAIFAVQFLVVFYLQAVRGYSPLSAAFALLPLPILNALVGPMGGIISDKIGARWPATIGLLIQAAALGWLSTITANSSYLQVAIGLALC